MPAVLAVGAAGAGYAWGEEGDAPAAGAPLLLAAAASLVAHLQLAGWLAKDLVWLVPDARCGSTHATRRWTEAYQSTQVTAAAAAVAAIMSGVGSSNSMTSCSSGMTNVAPMMKLVANKVLGNSLAFHHPQSHTPTMRMPAHPVRLGMQARQTSHQPLPFGARAGVMQQAVVVMADRVNITSLEVLIEGDQGQLPKLDMYSLLYSHAWMLQGVHSLARDLHARPWKAVGRALGVQVGELCHDIQLLQRPGCAVSLRWA